MCASMWCTPTKGRSRDQASALPQVRPVSTAPIRPSSGVLPSEPVKSLDEAPLGGEISEELLKILVCPEDKGPLHYIESEQVLFNPRLRRTYAVRDGIPVMLEDEARHLPADEEVPKA